MINNIHQAKTNLSKLIERALQGEDVIIAKAGKPIARLTKYNNIAASSYGILKGKVWMSSDFNDEDEKLNELFYGK